MLGRVKIFQQFAKRRAAVGDGELLFRQKLGKGLAKSREEKVRVVSESAVAPRRIDDNAIGSTFDDSVHLPGLGQGNGANVMRGPIEEFLSRREPAYLGAKLSFHLVNIRQQALVVPCVGGLRAGKSRGIDTRRAVEHVDANPGVIGEYPCRHVLAIVAGFLAGIRFKRCAVFNADGQVGESGKRFDVDARRFGSLTELPQLSGVGRGQEK